jgi:hypothetical protein
MRRREKWLGGGEKFKAGEFVFLYLFLLMGRES